MATTTQKHIKNKYNSLVHLISQMSDDVRVGDRWSTLSLPIHVYVNKRELISFKLSETSNTLEVEWGILYNKFGHWSFPNYFDQTYMFKTLVSKISDWYNDITSSNLDKVLKQAQDKVNSIYNI